MFYFQVCIGLSKPLIQSENAINVFPSLQRSRKIQITAETSSHDSKTQTQYCSSTSIKRKPINSILSGKPIIATGMEKQLNENSEFGDLSRQWNFVARTLDRVFLLLYVIAIVVSLLTLFPREISPNKHWTV